MSDENKVVDKSEKEGQEQFDDKTLEQIFEQNEVPSVIAEKIVAPVIEAHKQNVTRLQSKVSETIGKQKSLKSKNADLEKSKQFSETKISELQAKIETLETDLTAALNNKEDVDINEIVETRTKTLKSEYEAKISNLENVNSETQLKLDEQIKINRDQKNDYEISKVESTVGVAEFAKPDFRARMKQVFKYDEEEARHVARGSNGEPIFNPISPSEVVTYQTYAERVLRDEAPHLFTQYLSPSVNGNRKDNADYQQFFHSNGKPNLKGLQYRKEHGEDSFKDLESKFKKLKAA